MKSIFDLKVSTKSELLFMVKCLTVALDIIVSKLEDKGILNDDDINQILTAINYVGNKSFNSERKE
jgi:hypothetical protein